jgi:hypothetical protein
VTDGEGKELSLMVGVNSGDGRGNITAYATVFDSDEVMQADRDYSACSLNPNPVGSFTCGGSSTSAGGRFTDFSTYDFTVDTDTAFRDFDFGTDLYNFGPLNHFQRPERRYSLGAMGHYEFGEHADVYTQLMFNDYQSVAQIAPSGNFFDTGTIKCDNPFLPSTAWVPSVADRRKSPRAPPSRCTSAGAMSRVADDSNRSRTARSARSLAFVARSTKPGATIRRRSTRAFRWIPPRSITS